MDTLIINDGAVRLSINNDENKVITFYPTDVHFAESFFHLCDLLKEKQDAVKECKTAKEQMEAMTGFFAFLRSEVDKVFGDGTCDTVFGKRDILAEYIQFFNGVRPYIAKARQNEVDRYLTEDDGVMEE